MALQPEPVSADEAATAIERIRRRRHDIDDPQAWRLTDDPAEVLVYLRRYSGDIPVEVRRADVVDGLTLRLRMWWVEQEATLWLLEQARRVGVPHRVVGPWIGTGTKQGVRDHLRIVRARVGRLRGAPAQEPLPHAQRNAQATWIATHRTRIGEYAVRAAGFRDLADDDTAEWLDAAAAAARSGEFTALSVSELHLATYYLGQLPVVRALPDEHPVHLLLSGWLALYSTYPHAEPS